MKIATHQNRHPQSRAPEFLRCYPDAYGPHVANTVAAIGRLVHGLLAGLEPPAPAPRYVAVRPDGAVWGRTFATPAAAWRAIVGSTRGTRERRQDRADLEQAGWRVRAGSMIDGIE